MDGMDGIGSPGGRGYRAPYGANKLDYVQLSPNLHIHYVQLSWNLHIHYVQIKPFFTFLHTNEVSPQKKNNKIWTASGLLNPLKMQLGSFHNFYCCRIICISVVFVRQQTNTKDKGEVNLLDGPGCSLLSYCFLHRGCSHFDPPHRSLLPTCCTAIWCLTIYNSNL